MIHNEAKSSSERQGSQHDITPSPEKTTSATTERRGTALLKGPPLDDVPEGSDEDGNGNGKHNYRKIYNGSNQTVGDSVLDTDNEDDEDENEEIDIPTPPDGGWGWVIVTASFLSNVVVDGISYSFGIFLPEFVAYFNSSKSKTAWIGSLLCGCYLGVGPIVSAATNRFGCRPVAIFGSIISGIAFALSTFATSINFLMFSYGIIGGIGLGFIYLPAIVSVGYYFERRRAFATGIAVCGSGVGTLVMAPICRKLLDILNWQGALLIIAGIALNAMIFGALMRPLESKAPEKKKKPLLQRMAEEKQERLRRGSMPVQCQYQVVQHSDGTLEKRPKTLMNTEPGVHSTFNLDELEGTSVPENNTPRQLSPIKEFRPSSLPNKPIIPTIKTPEDEETIPEPDMKKSESISEGQSHHTSARNTETASGSVPNVTEPNSNTTSFKRRSSLKVPVVGIKPSLSNMTVNSDLRKHSLTVRLSASGFLMPGSRNNNHSIEEVWAKIEQDQRGDGAGSHRNSIALKPDKKEFSRPMYRKDIFYSGSIMNLPEYQSQKDLKSYLSSITSIPKETYYISQQQVDGITVLEKRTMCPCPCLPDVPKSMKDILSEMLDVSLLRDRNFQLLCAANVTSMLGFYIPFFFVVDQAILKGVSSDRAALFLSIIGLSNTIGRVISGIITDLPSVNALTVNNITLLLGGVTAAFMPFCPEFYSTAFLCVLYGLFLAPFIALTSIVIVELFGLSQLTNAFGLLTCFRGFAVVIGTPIAGALFDSTQSYVVPFITAGAMMVLASLFCFAIQVLKRLDNKNKLKNMEEYDIAVDDQSHLENMDLP